MNKLDAARLAANRDLANLVKTLVEQNPTMRFHQILRNFGFIVEDRSNPDGPPVWMNGFYEEPMKTLERVKREIANIYGRRSDS